MDLPGLSKVPVGDQPSDIEVGTHSCLDQWPLPIINTFTNGTKVSYKCPPGPQP